MTMKNSEIVFIRLDLSRNRGSHDYHTAVCFGNSREGCGLLEQSVHRVSAQQSRYRKRGRMIIALVVLKPTFISSISLV